MPSQKPVLYIIHGWTYTVAPWEQTIANLEKQGLKVEMLHVPGLTTDSKKVWTIDEYVKWADRHIPDGATALGHSNGGRILLNLCSEKPEKLAHLILLDSAGVYEQSSKRDVARSLSKKLGFLKKIPGLSKVWHKITGASDYARAPENMKKTLSNMLESDKKLEMSKVTTPTSILWGEEDTVTPPRQAEVMHSQLRNSRLEIFPEWRHAPYITHPVELAKVIFKTYKNPPKTEEPTVVTKTADVSASMTLKKAASPEIPSTADKSAALVFRKAKGPQAVNTAERSAALAVSSKRQKALAEKEQKTKAAETQALLDQLADVNFEQAEPDLTAKPTVVSPARQMITSASVPRKSRKNRKIRKKAKGKK